jgi:hypothetical protein
VTACTLFSFKDSYDYITLQFINQSIMSACDEIEFIPFTVADPNRPGIPRKSKGGDVRTCWAELCCNPAKCKICDIPWGQTHAESQFIMIVYLSSWDLWNYNHVLSLLDHPNKGFKMPVYQMYVHNVYAYRHGTNESSTK